MHTYAPYSKVFPHDIHSVVVTPNGHIQVLDSSTGSVTHSTSSSTELTDKVQKSGEVVSAAVDDGFKYLVTATSYKHIRVWEIDGLTVVSERETPKKPIDVCLTRDGQTILVSDKFGDVHRYPLRSSPANEVQAQESTSTPGSAVTKGARKRIADETLLLGHVSLLTTLLLSKDERYIITADRDEHIRVSWYPEAYTIESYCLGHRKFVSALHIPTWDPSLLISGGGDPELRIWNWLEGKLLSEVPISDVVMPFVKVVRKKPGRGEDESDGEGEGGASKGGSRGRRRGRKKRKGKEEAEHDEESGGELQAVKDDAKDDMQIDEPPEGPEATEKPESGLTTKLPPSEPSPLLAIQKIATIESGSKKFLIFSAHGATALFYCKFPELTSSPSSPVQVRYVTLEQPILDFAPWPSEDVIWVSVDGNWSDSTSINQRGAKFVKTIMVVDDELVLRDDGTHQSLVNSLNSNGRIEALPESLNSIDLYSALIVLPKNVDVEHNAMDDEALLSEATANKLSGKELGRLQTKRAVLALQTGQSSKREQSDISEDRTLKRQKSGSEAEAA